MITIFTTAKPFRGHDGVIQRNALKSWTLLHPDVEVILFGDDEGAAEVCAELGIRHEPYVERHESGTKYLNYIFKRVQEICRHDYICFSNCDIVLMDDFLKAFERAHRWRQRFLMVAQRWDIDIDDPIAFDHKDWRETLRRATLANAYRQDEWWIDVFVFAKGSYTDMPPLIVGHCYWDNWMIWKALNENVPVLDGTHFAMLVHQNHGYNPKFGRVKGQSQDPLSMWNLDLAGGRGNIRHIKSSTHVLTLDGNIRLNVSRNFYQVWKFWEKEIEPRLVYRMWLPTWHLILDVTRPARKILGLRSRRGRVPEKAQ